MTQSDYEFKKYALRKADMPNKLKNRFLKEVEEYGNA